jgi:hypothetical protein
MFAASALKPEWIRTIEWKTSNVWAEGFSTGVGVTMFALMVLGLLFK